MLYRDPGYIEVDGKNLRDYEDGVIGDIDAVFAEMRATDWDQAVSEARSRDLLALAKLQQCNFQVSPAQALNELDSDDWD
jgi:hypothetical protein